MVTEKPIIIIRESSKGIYEVNINSEKITKEEAFKIMSSIIEIDKEEGRI